MNERYLWDKTGRDPEVERLERLLNPFAYRPKRPRRWWAAPSAAAAILLGMLLLLPAAPESRVFDFGDLGTVTAEPGSSIELIHRSEDLIKLRLERGTIHASISASARPRLFQVETPTTTCVDLGCQYTLTVDAHGSTVVRVLSGRVAFVEGHRELYVPKGARCRAGGIPVFEDAPIELVQAVRAFEESSDRAAAARQLVAQVARPRDTLCLWHLLQDPVTEPIGREALERLVGVSDLEHLKPHWGTW